MTVAEMARMVGLSRARFYQLQGSAFPPPIYNIVTRRPVYPEELQTICLEVRRRNCGVDGKPVLFYARRHEASPPKFKRPSPRPAPKHHCYDEIMDGLRALGLISITPVQVENGVQELFPSGVAGASPAEVVRKVFLHLQRQNSADKVGR